jgi:hypothetical protein
MTEARRIISFLGGRGRLVGAVNFSGTTVGRVTALTDELPDFRPKVIGEPKRQRNNCKSRIADTHIGKN